MEMSAYQRQTLRTWSRDQLKREAIANAILSLNEEAGELAGTIKKWLYHGHELDLDETIKEMGDTLYYLSVLAYELNVTLDEVSRRNIAKLEERYPDGYSHEASRNRKPKGE